MKTNVLLREHYYYETYYLNEGKEKNHGYKNVDFDFDERNKRFAEILFACAYADGELSTQEKNFILGGCLARGCSERVVNSINPRGISDLEKAVTSFAKDYHNNMVSLVFEIIKVCSADGTFSPDEIKVVEKIAKWVSMPQKTLDALKALYNEEVAISKKLRQLCQYN